MHSEPLYRKIIHQALKRSWRHKHTWIFGFFATVLGFGGIVEAVMRQFAAGTNNLVVKFNPDAAGFAPLYEFRHAFDGYSNPNIMLALTIIFGLAFTVAFLWMSATSVAALITTSRNLDEGKDMHFAEGMKAGVNKTLPVLIISFLGKIVTILAVSIIFLILQQAINRPSSAGAILYGLAFIVMTAISIYILGISTYATLYSVLRRQRLGQAIAAGQRLLHKKWLLTLETAALLFITTIGLELLGFAITLTALLPVLFLFLIAVSTASAGAIILLVAITSFVLVLGITLTTSFIVSFQTMAWTILFERATENMAVAKLHRAEAWIRGKFNKNKK